MQIYVVAKEILPNFWTMTYSETMWTSFIQNECPIFQQLGWTHTFQYLLTSIQPFLRMMTFKCCLNFGLSEMLTFQDDETEPSIGCLYISPRESGRA